MALKPHSTEELIPYRRHFSDSAFWKKFSGASRKIGRTASFYALVLYYVMLSPNVSFQNKCIICGALGYLVLPTDLLPDVVPLLGFTDDIAAIKLAYDAVKVSITPDVENKAKERVDKIFGEE